MLWSRATLRRRTGLSGALFRIGIAVLACMTVVVLVRADENKQLPPPGGAPTNHKTVPISARYADTGIWLAYDYGNRQDWVDRIPQVASQLWNDYHVLYVFVNVGLLNSSGRIGDLPPSLVSCLDRFKAWEGQHGHQFKVLACINGNTRVVDPNSEKVRANILDEATRMVTTTISNSYVAGAKRAFDGVQLDLEPAGPNGSDVQYNNIKQLMMDIKAAFASMGHANKLTSFTPGAYTIRAIDKWGWPAAYYYDMGSHVDLLCAMTYDSDITNGAAYQSWIQDQTTNILRATSGKSWHNDALHPAPTNGVKVMIGFPAYANSAHHTNTAENIIYAATGVNAAIADLAARGDHSTNFFQGAAIFSLTDGTGSDGRASYEKDLRWFREYWLGAR
jgi:hypothetical protein